LSTLFERMSVEQRITAVNVDFSNHATFSQMAGVAVVGNNHVVDDGSVTTAGTDGQDVWYSRAFMQDQNRKQTRWIVLHETMHKGLHHCTEYKDLYTRDPDTCNIAMDYVVNGLIEEADPKYDFTEKPAGCPIFLHKKYSGWSFPQVLKDLLKNSKPIKDSGGKQIGKNLFDPDGKPIGGSFDQHIMSEIEGKVADALKQEITDSLQQGKRLSEKLAGQGKRNDALNATLRQRDTNWKQYFWQFFTELCEGDDQSRFSPPNKRLLPWCIMPSHFSEATGEIIIACDTSGSMHGLYPTVFGEIARICDNVKPDSVRVLWWEYAVVGDQQFKAIDYPNIAKLMKPVGGGGTRLTSVAEYIESKKYKPKAIIYLTDGWIESNYRLADFPTLFGAVDNDDFVASKGRTVRIYS